MVSIKVVSKDTGKPMKGVGVGLSAGLDGVWHEDTDSEGVVHFQNASPGQAEFYIKNKTYKEHLSGMKVVYI